MAGMDFEQPRQKQARAAGHVRARPAFELRQVGLAELPLQFVAYRASDFGLRHFAAHTTGVSFQRPEMGELLAEFHCNSQYIARCDIWQEACTLITDVPSPVRARSQEPGALLPLTDRDRDGGRGTGA